jgi:dephospho-CoA kinase
LERFGTVSRHDQAAIVFNDPDALADLNALTHPAVGAVIAERLAASAETDDVVVLDIPLLVESSNSAYPLAGIVVVDAPVEVAVQRLVEQRGMAREDALARINAQASREERLARANYVIDNAGTVEQLADAVERCWEWIKALSA